MDEEKREWRPAAVEQARQIQKQRQIQDQVFDTIIDLIDLPCDANSDADSPLASELQLFQKGVSLFSPEDFDQMALERNIYEKCGYALCRKKINLSSRKGTHAILWARKGADLNVVPQREVPKWCSQRCEKYAHLIRKQLLNEPAWERQGLSKKLYIPLPYNGEEDLPERYVRVADGSENSQDLAGKMEALSIERAGAGHHDEKLTNFHLVEKAVNKANVVPPQSVTADPETIEGYAPNEKLQDDAHRDNTNDSREDLIDLLLE